MLIILLYILILQLRKIQHLIISILNIMHIKGIHIYQQQILGEDLIILKLETMILLEQHVQLELIHIKQLKQIKRIIL